MFKRAAPPAKRTPDAARAPSIVDTAPCEKRLSLTVGPEVIAALRAQVVGEFQRKATLPGFRQGKAPREVVEQRFAQDIHDETLQRATKQAIQEAAKAHALKPVGPFELQTVNYTEAEGLTLQARVEVEPTFTLASYKGIALQRMPADVSPQELDQAMEQLRQSMAKLAPAGEGQPKEPQAPPLDDELAKDVGFESLAKAREHIEAKLREQKRHAAEQALESALCDELLKRHAFDVPPRLVDHQTERLARDFKARLLLSGLGEEEVAKKVEAFAAQLRDNAQRLVKLGFILDRIAQQEQLTVSESELVQRLWQLAQRWRRDPREIRKLFDEQGLWPSVLSTVRQEKTVAWLLASAAIEDGSSATAGVNRATGGSP